MKGIPVKTDGSDGKSGPRNVLLRECALHEDGRFARVAIVVFTAAGFGKTMLGVKGDGPSVGFANLEEHAGYAAAAQRFPCGTEESPPDSAATTIRADGQI